MLIKGLYRTTDLERDWWLVEDADGTLVAGGVVRLRHPHRLRSEGGVLPEQRGNGIGTELRDRIEERARELAAAAPKSEEVWLGAAPVDERERAAVLRSARL